MTAHLFHCTKINSFMGNTLFPDGSGLRIWEAYDREMRGQWCEDITFNLLVPDLEFFVYLPLRSGWLKQSLENAEHVDALAKPKDAAGKEGRKRKDAEPSDWSSRKPKLGKVCKYFNEGDCKFSDSQCRAEHRCSREGCSGKHPATEHDRMAKKADEPVAK